MTELMPSSLAPEGDLLERVAALIEQGRAVAVSRANAAMSLTNWHVGRLINEEILHNERADYGKQIVASLTQQLTARFGRGYDTTSLSRMRTFAREFPDEEIVVALVHQLSWTHIGVILPLKSAQAREFYIRQTAERHLSVRELRAAVDRKAYERREIAGAQIARGTATPLDDIRDPYLLDFLGLDDHYQERDLEDAIINQLEPFLLEVGRGWAFVGRQVRMSMGSRDYHLDLLFYSRPMRRLVAVELKLGEFLPEYEGQMRFYLTWLNHHERGTDEAAPLGLILCSSTDREQIEMMELSKDNIVVAEYWTDLLPKKELEERLGVILREAKERLARRALQSGAETEDEE
ncbi:MAG: PDDEXK nuclease domain-containing protein [Propionibacteriaceae bacterium]|nr:PDDEXK nuclease domain-containing protein [Propionibacteriaceae bacterium]